MLPKSRTRAFWIAVSLLAALFVATELTPRTSNRSRTFVGHIWTRLGLTGLYGSVRDGELAGRNEFYVIRTENGFKLLTSDELFSTYDLDRVQATQINEVDPEYHVIAQVAYQWGGFVYNSWMKQEYSFFVADPDTSKKIDDPELIGKLQLATADWLESGKLHWTKWKAPRWPSDLRSGESGWKETYTQAYLWDVVWCGLCLLSTISVGHWLRLVIRQFRMKQTDTIAP